MRCIQVCDKIQALQHLGRGRNRQPHHHRRIQQPGHQGLGLRPAAASASPTAPPAACGSGTTPSRAFDALADPDKITVVQVAPAVRTAWGEAFGLPRRAGHRRAVWPPPCASWASDYVFDTNFTADLTIMEEGSEFFAPPPRRASMAQWPMFTSCCPGWVRFLKGQYPAAYRAAVHRQEPAADVWQP